jgi:phospho-N-acetylmuramoyl-pentapeptide-transferase
VFSDLALNPYSLPVIALVGFLLSVVLYPPFIAFLKKKEIGQFIREEGPASHAAKARTPTMGGVCFIIATICATMGSLFYYHMVEPKVLIVLAVALFCGLVGFVDDLAKFRRKANAGLSAKSRLFAELMLGGMAGACLLSVGAGTDIIVGNFPNEVITLPIPIYLMFSAFLVAGTSNALNLHDGMDGLASGTSISVLATLSILLAAFAEMLFIGSAPAGAGYASLAVCSAAAAGAVAGFLVYNRYPARIFMGDTGSLFIGGLLSGLALAGRIEIWFIPLALIYIVETLSVMAQVVYFKLTKEYTPPQPMSKPALVWLKLTKRLPGEGKRLFRMAPLHHHFEEVYEEKGVPEWEVVAGFWVAQIILCLAVLLLFRSV